VETTGMAADSEQPDDAATTTADLDKAWKGICREVEAVHREMSQSVDEPFRQLFYAQAENFAALGAPITELELTTRRMQRAALSGRIAALAEAGALAMLNPRVAAAIAVDAEQFCRPSLPLDESQLREFHRNLVDFMTRVSLACRMSQLLVSRDASTREA
jgi:hypothetical protein